MPRVLPCQRIGWQEVQRLSRELALTIQREGSAPDIIVAIGRGGYVPGRILADYLDTMALTSIKVEHYRHGAQRQAAAVVKYPMCVDIEGLEVLLVDDVSDSGDTYTVALDHLRERGPRRVVTAALHHKTVSSYRPDFYAEEVDQWRWLIYPWAIIEDLSGFLGEMEGRPQSIAGIRERVEQDFGIEVSEQEIGDALALVLNKKGPRSGPFA